MKGASKFWVGVGMLLVLAGAAVWAEMQHRPAQVNATPAAASAPNAQQAPPATQQQPESAPKHHGGPAVGEG